MFLCSICKKVSKLREKATVRIIEKRKIVYEYGRYRRKKVTEGWEIVQEAKMCNACGILYDKEHSIPENEISELIAA